MSGTPTDPFAGLVGSDDDENTAGTFVSMDDFRVTPGFRESLPNMTPAASQSSAALLDPDSIADHELMNNVGDGAYNHLVQDTSAFMWDLGRPLDQETPARNDPPLRDSQAMNLNLTPGTFAPDSLSEMGTAMKETPRVVRAMFDAMKTPRAKRMSEMGDEPSLSISEAVTSFSIPNPFRAKAPYSNLANPDAEESSLVLFSRNGPAGKEEINALVALANATATPLARLVQMLVYTVEFQNHELTTLKQNEIGSVGNEAAVQHRLFSEIDRKKSLTIRSMIEDLDIKDARIAELEKALRELEEKHSAEKNFNNDFRVHCESMDSSIRFENGVKSAFDALNTYLHGNRRRSEMTMTAQKVELEEYAERLLDLEAKVSDGQRRQDALLQENTALKVELASLSNAGNGENSNLETPALHCHSSNNHHIHIDNSAMQVEVNTLTERRDELQKELRESNRSCRKREDELFKARIDLDESHAKVKSFTSQLKEAEAHINILKKNNIALEEQSRQISKELTQNTIDACKEIDKKEMDLKHLQFELSDHQQAMESYKETIAQLEKQINVSTKDIISHGMSVVSGEESPSAVEERRISDRAVRTLQREIDSAKKLLEARSRLLDDSKQELHRVNRDLKLTEDELSFWKSQVQQLSREAELNADRGGHVKNQEGDFLRRLSMQLGCRADNKHDLIGKLVKRVEDFMKERGAFEVSNEKLHAEIVERERALHVLRQEFETEISSLRVEVQQLENARDRAVNERAAAEAKLTEIDETEHNFTIDATQLTLGAHTEIDFGDEDRHWDDPTIDAAVQAVRQLIGLKNSIVARNQQLIDKLNNILNQDFGENGSAEVSKDLILESRAMQQSLVKIIGQQANAIRKLKSNKVKSADGQGGEGEDHSLNLSVYEEDATVTLTENFTSFTENSKMSPTSPFAMHRLSKATKFLRQQLDEMRAQMTDKMSANAELSSVIKGLEVRLEGVMGEKRGIEARVKSLSNLHENFVQRLGDLCNVQPSPVMVESCVRDLIGNVSSLEVAVQETTAVSDLRFERVFKLLGQKRLLEHIIGIYQRKYHLDVIALPPKSERAPALRLKGAIKSVMALVRLNNMFHARSKQAPTNDFMDASSVYDLPIQQMIGETRDTYLSLTSAALAVGAVPKLELALKEREMQIAELRRSLATLNTSFPPTDAALMGAGHPSSFDYSQDVIDRKNELARKLKKALQEKEQLEVRLSHEKEHRLSAEARSNKYLEKATKLHSKLKAVQLSSSNRERTYKAAIRYLKAKADSAIDVDFREEIQREQSATERDLEAAGGPKENKLALSQVLHAQMNQALTELEELTPGTVEYKQKSTYILGLRSATKRLRKTSSGSAARRGTATREPAMM